MSNLSISNLAPARALSGLPIVPATAALAAAVLVVSGCASTAASTSPSPSASPSVPARTDAQARNTTIVLGWPTVGPVVRRFDGQSSQGLAFSGPAGAPVLAASDGQVMYAGAGVKGWGQLVLIRHDEEFVTAYGHNRKLLVQTGDQVKAGQPIAEMGNTEADRVMLRFELRRSRQPVDPEKYMLARNAASSRPAPSRGASADTASRSGSGFAVNRTQWVTNAHVVQDCPRVELPGRGVARIAALDRRADLALLELPAGPGGVALSPGRLRQGDSVTVLGYPLRGLLAQGVQVTTGHVTALSVGIKTEMRLFQLTAPVQSGNSGGPVVDASGHVVGVVVGKLNALRAAAVMGDIPQNVNFAISLAALRGFLDANRVSYRTAATTGRRLDVADAADAVKAHTLPVVCHGAPD